MTLAVFINNRRSVTPDSQHGDDRDIVEYFIDSAADIALLPDATKIKETSTAIDLATGDVYALATGGWGKIP